eukprot:CAMPEP_0197589234 /NCGR_PEP_ID=MMETSP1326-20131121/10248_1 /TAXON_ID=1155430 /ORGANISM="Genus nov. species nov., Strain RCC2288" /LENGTH=308 /DNA_ID=CAMNT_0043154147 /DNA_START=157 /DNA_END=1083 /DNA_ORIENTATION=+
MACMTAASSATCRAPVVGRAAAASASAPRAAAFAPASSASSASSSSVFIGSSRKMAALSASAAPRGAVRTSALFGAAAPVAVVAASVDVTTVSETKKKFVDSYPFPIPSIWSVAIQELLVTQHFVKYNSKYTYSKLSSLGFCSVYEQLFEGFPNDAEKASIFDCFLKALEEDPAATRKDAEELTAFATGAGSVDGLLASPLFAELKALNADKKFAYSRYDAIGLFRMLELAKATEPAALEKLSDAAGIKLSSVNGDLGLYKGLLFKLAAAKELQKEIFDRERKKQAERDATKAAKAAAAAAAPAEPTA